MMTIVVTIVIKTRMISLLVLILSCNRTEVKKKIQLLGIT